MAEGYLRCAGTEIVVSKIHWTDKNSNHVPEKDEVVYDHDIKEQRQLSDAEFECYKTLVRSVLPQQRGVAPPSGSSSLDDLFSGTVPKHHSVRGGMFYGVPLTYIERTMRTIAPLFRGKPRVTVTAGANLAPLRFEVDMQISGVRASDGLEICLNFQGASNYFNTPELDLEGAQLLLAVELSRNAEARIKSAPRAGSGEGDCDYPK